METDRFKDGIEIASTAGSDLCRVTAGGEPVTITKTSARILRILVERARHSESATTTELVTGIYGCENHQGAPDVLHQHVNALRKKLSVALGAKDFLKSRPYRLEGHIETLGGSPLWNLMEWLVPSGAATEVLVSLGTRTHRPFPSQPDAKRLAGASSADQLRDQFQQWARDSYRALAVDAAGMAEVAALIARQRPSARIRSMPDFDVLLELNREGEQDLAVISLGMGNVNAVSATIVRHLASADVTPRPAGEETNGLLGYDGRHRPDVTAPNEGCVAVVSRRHSRRSVRWLLSAGVGATGTLLSNAFLLRLLSPPSDTNLSKELAFLTRGDAGAVLVTGRVRDEVYYRQNGVTFHEDKSSRSTLPFPVAGIDPESPYALRPQG